MAEFLLKAVDSQRRNSGGQELATVSERSDGGRFRVGDLVVNIRTGAVTRGGQALTLSPLTFELLAALIRRAPEVVRRRELLDAVWPREYVNDNTVSQRVRMLREALGEEAGGQRYIVSLRGWGYKLAGPVERLEGEEAIRSLAVLPLANLSGDPRQEYFADGMTEILISALAKIRAIKVVSRTSVMRYKKAERRLPQIARELGVDGVIEGAVMVAGTRVRVSAQLIRAATDEHLWGESYDRDLGDVLALHAELARSIARQIRAVITPSEEATLQVRRSVDPAAHAAELKGRYFLAKLTPADLGRAIEHFEAAAVLDPSFSLPHSGLANTLFLLAVPLGMHLTVPATREYQTRAKKEAITALELDENVAEAHAALGMTLLFHDWDWAGSERELDRALELDSNSSFGHGYRAALASTRMDRATTLREVAYAACRDPLNLMLLAEAAECCWWVREYSSAIGYAHEALELEPPYPRAHYILGRVFEAQERIEETIAEYECAGLLSPALAAAAREAWRRGGAPGFHRWALEVELSRTDGLATRSFYRARLHSRAGAHRQALASLEQAYEERDCLMVLLKALDWWDPLREDPGFADLVARVGIP